MFKRVLFFCLIGFLVTGSVVCKKKPPTKDETRNALREAPVTINTDVLNNLGTQALTGSGDVLSNLPLFSTKKLNMLKVLTSGKKAIPRIALRLLNSNGPWDTLAGKWRWNQTNYQWEHYSNTPSDSILFEWVFTDTSMQTHNCLLAFSNYDWTTVGGEDALTKLRVDLRVDNTSYFLLDLKEVKYGTTVEDVRKIDISLTVLNYKFTFVFDYTSPPKADLSFRFEITNNKPWYQIAAQLKDPTAPFGDSVIAQNGTYTDYNGWKVAVTFAEPDTDGIQLVEGEISKSGAHAATIKSEKRYNEYNYPYLYIWLEYPDGTKETPEELFGDLFPQGKK